MNADTRTPFERAMGDTPIQVVSLGESLPSYTTLHYQLQNALAVNVELVKALQYPAAQPCVCAGPHSDCWTCRARAALAKASP